MQKLQFACILDKSFVIFAQNFQYMLILRTISETQDHLDGIRHNNKTIGLVPTMGALHEGHLSLIRTCSAENDMTIVSIFVNPTQFNDPEDFNKYPRDFDNDIAILKNHPCDLVFAPSIEEMYPFPDTREFRFGTLDSIMEGKYRPGHFNGVAQIVSKLFEIIKPGRAYFGQKDFQQLVVIRDLVRQLDLSVQIVSCPIIREHDGLAMSSRNQLLTEKQRIAAGKINKSLEKAVLLAGKTDVGTLRKNIISEIDSDPLLKAEYFEIVDEETLKPVSEWSDKTVKIGCIAVQVGNVRLIDNIKIS